MLSFTLFTKLSRNHEFIELSVSDLIMLGLMLLQKFFSEIKIIKI